MPSAESGIDRKKRARISWLFLIALFSFDALAFGTRPT